MYQKLLSKLAFVDVETTGTSAMGDRVIDIGIIRVEEGKVVEEFETLVNPQTHLSPFITSMTSITPEMLYKAPTFEEIKSKIYDLLEGTTFVAHNAQFDYAFIKQEFSRLETKFNSKILCTVRLSRALFPGERHHNLDSVIERMGINVENRHRAFPDAKAIYQFYESVQKDLPEDRFLDAINSITKKSRLPNTLDPLIIKSIPNLPGVYIFYDRDGTVLYVGKSTHLKNRVMSHFSSFHSNSTDFRLAGSVADIEIRRTGGDLSASLLEAELIKALQPVYNRVLRRSSEVAAVIKNKNKDYHFLEIKRVKVPLNPNAGEILAVYPSIKKAKEEVALKCKEYKICPKFAGIENSIKGKTEPCFYFQLGLCLGACVRKVSPLKHNIKLMEAFGSTFIPRWPFEGEIAIKEESGDLGELIHINNWMHVGHSTIKNSDVVFKEKESAIYTDTVKILKRFLGKPEYLNKIVTR